MKAANRPPMLEADFQARVIAYAELNGWRVFHPRPARIGKKIATWQQGHRGYPDLTLARDGVVILAELKRDGEYPSPDQRKWRDAIGTQWRLWRPQDWDAVKSELDRPRRLIRPLADESHRCDSKPRAEHPAPPCSASPERRTPPPLAHHTNGD